MLDPSPGPGEEAESKPRIEKMFGRRAALGARSVSAVGSEPGLRPPPLYRGVQPLARPRPGQERRLIAKFFLKKKKKFSHRSES